MKNSNSWDVKRKRSNFRIQYSFLNKFIKFYWDSSSARSGSTWYSTVFFYTKESFIENAAFGEKRVNVQILVSVQAHLENNTNNENIVKIKQGDSEEILLWTK